MELILQHHLQTLSETLQQQLQEMERRQEQELERRIQQNAALSTNMHKEEAHVQQRNTGLIKVSSTSALISSQGIHPSKSSEFKHARTDHCERTALAMTWPNKEEEAMAECLKKFSALTVPSHVTAPLFKEIMVKREKQRQQGHEQRKNFLLSMQKPFGFEEREKEKRAKLIATINEASKQDGNKDVEVNHSHKITKGSKHANRESRKVPIQTAENASVSEGPTLRTADRTRTERVGFLDESPSFRPKIIRQVPDFHRLHKALQRDKMQTKDTTKCQPFHLRTSALAARQSRSGPQQSQAQKVSHLSRSKSLGALTSLSMDTLPVYITDATRKRAEAIRKSMDSRESRVQESAEWLRKYQMRSEDMQRTVALHAKLLDPHRSLKEVYNEKLQHHREADEQRMREYGRELKGMRARVRERPFLFQQVKQKSAKANAEKTYRDTLQSAGLKEEFVEENGLSRLSSSSSISEGNTDASSEDQLSRTENGDAGGKIEDVKEKSVNYKGDEMP
ncbi:protein FAM161B [Eucyclogobius newberryi]|uniref:protein FAM161B n=1 Tax=Eucyclogobius newberryi TaxID=166745 RepID=UPI003B5AE648